MKTGSDNIKQSKREITTTESLKFKTNLFILGCIVVVSITMITNVHEVLDPDSGTGMKGKKGHDR